MFTSAGRSRRISDQRSLRRGVDDVDQTLVSTHFEVLTAVLVLVRRADDAVFFSVGSGTGPTTVAPARVTVSTIFRAEESMTSWSYDFSRMRIFVPPCRLTLFR